MKNAIKDIFLMGVGVASLTRKKAEPVVRVFVKKGIITNKQAKEIIGKMVRESNKIRSRLKKEGEREYKRVKAKVISTGKGAVKKVSRGIDKATRKIIKEGMNL